MRLVSKIFLVLFFFLTNICFAQKHTNDSVINVDGLVDPDIPEFIGGNDSLKNLFLKILICQLIKIAYEVGFI